MVAMKLEWYCIRNGETWNQHSDAESCVFEVAEFNESNGSAMRQTAEPEVEAANESRQQEALVPTVYICRRSEFDGSSHSAATGLTELGDQ